jgi:hypothetical protein
MVPLSSSLERHNDPEKRGAIVLKRSFGVLIAITIGTAACGSSSSTSPPAIAPQSPTTTVSSAPAAEPILGTWRMEYTCEALVRAYKRYGVSDQLAAGLATFGIHKSSTDRTTERICEGARQYQRTHFFRPNGYLINYQGNQIVDDCHCYQLVDNHTFVNLGTDPGDIDVSLHYMIDGNKLTFDVVTPDQCSAKCLGGVAFAVYQYALGPWQRVG